MRQRALNRHTTVKWTAAAGLAATVLAGCGGSDTPSNAASSGATVSPGATGATRPAAKGWAPEKPAHGAPRLRAVITDAGSGKIGVLDLANGTTVKELQVAGRARAIAAEDGTHLVLPQADAGVTNVMDAGIRWEGHGDHQDPAHVTPALVPGEIKGGKATHVVPHGGSVAVFADTEGDAHVLDPDAGKVTAERVVRTGRGHHGVAVRIGDQVITSLPPKDAAAELPGGVQVVDAKGTPVQKFENCPELHGEFAPSDRRVLFGCGDGVLVLTKEGGRWTGTKIPNPPRTGAPAADASRERVGAFFGPAESEGEGPIFGTYGGRAIVSVDVAGSSIKRIDLPAELAAYIWDPYWRQGVILTTDGVLRAVDPKTGTLARPLTVLAPFTVPKGHGGAKPAIATGETAVYVTDPAARTLTEVKIGKAGFQVGRSLGLPYTPFSLAVLGMSEG